jgi:hypothetical protein
MGWGEGRPAGHEGIGQLEERIGAAPQTAVERRAELSELMESKLVGSLRHAHES